MLKLLAFDYGASSGRAMMGRFDGASIQIEEVHRFSNDPVMLHGSYHWDVLRLFHEMKQGILKCAKNGDRDIAAIGTDTWGVDFGLLDAKGALLCNPYHYRDTRTDEMIALATARVSKEDLYETTGIAFQKYNTLYQLLSMVEGQSAILDNAKTLLFMPDLLNYFLTGIRSTEYTIASTSQMLEARTGEWARALLGKIGVPTDLLTPIIKPSTIKGFLSQDISRELNIAKLPVIAVAGHDTGCAVASVPVMHERFAYISSGTWSLMGIESNQPIINPITYSMNYTNEGGINDTIRLLKNIMGLWIYQECKRYWDKFDNVTSFDTLESMAEQSKPFKCWIDPDAPVFYTPGDMPLKIVEFCAATGQPIPENKGEMVRCIMESLALKYRFVLQGLEKIAGYDIPVVHVVGGGSRNRILNQFTANATQKPVIAGPIEATSLGNFISQLIALKEVGSLKEARALVKGSFVVEEYLPEQTTLWEDAYSSFEKRITIY